MLTELTSCLVLDEAAEHNAQVWCRQGVLTWNEDYKRTVVLFDTDPFQENAPSSPVHGLSKSSASSPSSPVPPSVSPTLSPTSEIALPPSASDLKAALSGLLVFSPTKPVSVEEDVPAVGGKAKKTSAKNPADKDESVGGMKRRADDLDDFQTTKKSKKDSEQASKKAKQGTKRAKKRRRRRQKRVARTLQWKVSLGWQARTLRSGTLRL